MPRLRVLYQDEHYVAVNKPAGLLVHRSEMDPGERRFALQILRDQLGQHVYPVHRLDKPTSGLLLFGLTPEAASRAQQAFRERQVVKEYLAICRGWMDDGGEIDYALTDKRERMTREEQERPPQPAQTRYRTLARTELPIPLGRYPGVRYSLLHLMPRTGRKHQLRRHLKHCSHPIIGDTCYGDGKHNRLFRNHFNARRLMLFAIRLQMIHPVSGEPVRIEAPLPRAVYSLFTSLGFPTELPEAEPFPIDSGAFDEEQTGQSA